MSRKAVAKSGGAMEILADWCFRIAQNRSIYEGVYVEQLVMTAQNSHRIRLTNAFAWLCDRMRILGSLLYKELLKHSALGMY